MKTKVVGFWNWRKAAVGGGAVLAALQSQAQLTYSSGTNAVVAIADTIDTSSAVMLPIVVGVILLCTAIGVYYRLSAKAKIRS